MKGQYLVRKCLSFACSLANSNASQSSIQTYTWNVTCLLMNGNAREGRRGVSKRACGREHRGVCEEKTAGRRGLEDSPRMVKRIQIQNWDSQPVDEK